MGGGVGGGNLVISFPRFCWWRSVCVAMALMLFVFCCHGKVDTILWNVYILLLGTTRCCLACFTGKGAMTNRLLSWWYRLITILVPESHLWLWGYAPACLMAFAISKYSSPGLVYACRKHAFALTSEKYWLCTLIFIWSSMCLQWSLPLEDVSPGNWVMVTATKTHTVHLWGFLLERKWIGLLWQCLRFIMPCIYATQRCLKLYQ